MSRLIQDLPYSIKVAIVSMSRHLAMTFSAISAVSVTLSFLGVVIILAANMNAFSHNIEADIRIHAVLHESIVSQASIDRIEKEMYNIDHISDIAFSSKDEELELMISERGEELEIYRGEENPLSHAFFIRVDNPHHLKEVSDLIEEISGVRVVYYGDDAVSGMVDLLASIRLGGLLFLGLLVFFAIFLIANAIKMTIYARQDEIAIMRQVGAENWFIKIPFVIEGLLIGILGSIVPSLLVGYGYRYLYQVSGGRLITSLFTLMEPLFLSTCVIVVIILCGVLVGMIGSLLSTEKYLRWKR